MFLHLHNSGFLLSICLVNNFAIGLCCCIVMLININSSAFVFKEDFTARVVDDHLKKKKIDSWYPNLGPKAKPVGIWFSRRHLEQL